MKEIQLTKGKVALVDDADYDWLNQWKWYAIFDGRNWYAQRNLLKKDRPPNVVRMHRAILGITDPKVILDHKDRNGLNNTRDNLRTANESQNGINRRQQKNSKTGAIGVCVDAVGSRVKRYRAYITVDGKTTLLGRFKTLEEAVIARQLGEIRYFGEYAKQ